MQNTTDPQLRAFFDIAPDADFSVQNLPYGIFRRDKSEAWRAGVAIGDVVLDLAALERHGFFAEAGLPSPETFAQPALNAFMACPGSVRSQVRQRCSALLTGADSRLKDDADLRKEVLIEQADIELKLPVDIGDYTDFYSSREHATNVGIMFRGKDNALQPNWLHLPVGYHGRASSVIVSGEPVRRPCGQLRPDDAAPPIYGPCRLLDFELEMGYFIGPGNALGTPIRTGDAKDHVFGLALVNDWSARDIQKWEYVPLGPFLAKNFATSISPWIVPLEALEPFRTQGPAQDDPVPLPYLQHPGAGGFDIHLEVELETAGAKASARISHTNFKFMYWNLFQQIAHHTVTGCNLRPGDLLASGTISGPAPDSYGSLLELTWRGSRPLDLGNGVTRKFLEDGDTVTMRGWCEGAGYRVGFGEVSATILPATPLDLR